MDLNELKNLTKKLRDETSISILECKNALEKLGNYEHALNYLYTEYATKIAEKKKDNPTENKIFFLKKIDKSTIKLISIGTETDVLLYNDKFFEFGNLVLNEIEASEIKKIMHQYIARLHSNLTLESEKIIKGKHVYYYIHSPFGSEKSNMGLSVSIIDSENPIENSQLSQELCKFVFLCNSDDLNVFKSFIYDEDNNLTIDSLLVKHNIIINKIYLQKVIIN